MYFSRVHWFLGTLLVLFFVSELRSQQLPVRETDTRTNEVYSLYRSDQLVWFRENLRYPTSGGLLYSLDPDNRDTYGYLYLWDVSIQVCPSGWHLPSDVEWQYLERHWGMDEATASQEGDRVSNVSDSFRLSTGYDAVYGGYYYDNCMAGLGEFRGKDQFSYWWSSTSSGKGKAWVRKIESRAASVGRESKEVSYGYSVRCVHDVGFPSALSYASPSVGATDFPDSVKLVWHTSELYNSASTIRYIAYVGQTPSSLTAVSQSVTDTFAWVRGLAFNTTYYWRVDAYADDRFVTRGEVRNFQTSLSPLPVAQGGREPGSGEINVGIPPRLKWQPPMDPQNHSLVYDVYLWEKGMSEVKVGSDLSDSEYIPPQDVRLKGHTWYYWKVVARNIRGAESVSSLDSFRTQNRFGNSLVLLSPDNRFTPSTLQPVTLRWSDVKDPDGDDVSYRVYLGVSSDALSPIGTTIRDTFYQLRDNEISQGRDYYWAVFSEDGFGGSLWSGTFRFRIGGNRLPLAFTLLSPSDNEGNISLQRTLSWNESVDPDGDAVHYEVYLRTQGSLDYTRLFQSTKITQTESPSFRFKQGTSYEWKVVAEDAMGGRKESSVWDFTTTFPPTIPSGPPSPLGGQEGVVQPVTLSRPEAVDPDGDEINYDIYLWKRGASRKRIAEGLSTPSYTIPRYDLQGHTWYYWEVIAKDDKGGQSTYGKDSFLTANTFGERLVLLDPTNGSGSVDVSQSSVLFRWGQVIDRDGDAVSYQVYLGLDSRSLSALGSSQSDTFRNVQSSAIVGGRTFYWYVRSWDNYGGELLSDTFYFTIGGNRSPGLFTLDYPVSGMVNSYLDSSFHWSRSIDPDGDRVSYEVYWWEGGKSLPSDPIERTNDTTVRSLPKLQSNTLYRWKVVARDDGGSTREVGPQSFTTSSPPSRVSESGRSPSNGERDVSLPPRFAWEGSTDPDGDASNIEYDIYLGLSRGSLERIASSLSSPSYSLTGMKLLGHTWYYWQIVSRDEKGAEAYSQLDSFRTANRFPTSFSLLTPLDGSTSGIPAVFRWESLKDEDGDNIFYQFYIGTTRDNLVARGTSQLDTNFSLPELSGSSVFYWKVSAKDNYGGEIESSVWEFRLKDRKPTEFTLLYPSDRMTNVHLDSILYWSKSSDPDGGSVRYRVYIGIGGVPSSESYSSTSDTFQATVSPSLLADREYYWKVVAEDDGGATRGSSSFSFRTTQSPPSPNGGHRPSNGAVDVSIPTSLGWTGVDDPEGELVVYDVYFGSDRDNLALVSQGQRTASYVLPEGELRGHTWYYWRVEALDPRGGKGVSTTDSFLTANRFPSSLSLLSPVDASTGNTVPLTLSWESLTDLDGDAISYTLYLGTSIGGLSAKSVSQSGNSYILRDSDLEGSSTYYWRVEATDGYSSLSSSTNSFTLQNRPPGSFALVYPVEGQSNVRLDSVFRWNQSLDLDGDDVVYDLYYGVTDLPTQATERSLSDTTFRYQLLSGTTYRWQVLARDASTGRTFSTVWQFSTSRAPATPQNPRPSTGSLDVSIPLVVRVDETSDPDGDKVLYDLYFGTDKSSLPLVSSNSETPSYTPPASGLRGHTWYYWRVVAKDSKGASSSLLDSFRTANRFPTSVTLLSPDDNGLSSDPVELKWSSIDELDGDVVSYQVYFGTSLGGLSEKGSVQTDTTYRLTTADLDGSNEFYWRVEATDGEGGSAASVTRRFTLGNRPPGVFALRSPSDRASNVSLTCRFEWYRSIDPDRHDVRYDLYVGESLPGTASYSSLEDTFRVVKLESDKTYRWKVVADDNNSGTRESSEWSFSTTESPPSPDGGHRPSNGEVDVSIPTSLGWTGVDDPEGELVVYNVYFGSDRDNLALVSEGQTTTSYAIQESGLRGHTWYYWRVDALDPKGGKGESSLDSFRTANRFPGSFSLFSPANNSSDQTSPVTLRWESIEDADGDEISYRVFWGRSSAGLSEMALVVRDTFYRVPDDSLNHGSSYYWRVEASDGQGGQIVSVIYRFDMGNRSPNAFSLRWPTNGLENVSVRPVLSWDSSLDVDGDELFYDVYLGVDNVPSSASYSNLSDTFLTLGSSLSASSLYRWRVVAKDPHGGEKSSTTFWFETSGVPDRPISNKRPGSGQENISIPLSEVGVDKVLDPDGDKVLYDFYFGKKGSLQKVLTNVEEPVYVPPAESLTGHTWYYWRVVAKDGKGLESNSGLDSFRTANRFPTLLTLLRPADESLDLKEPIELVWEALDDLDGDKISYQLYYGSTEITLSKKGTQQSDTTYTLLSSDVSGSRYYWRVEGTDAYGGRVLSEVFSFTRPNLLPTAFSLVSPSDKDQSVSLQPEFSWTASSDGNNDELRYYITWWSSGNSRPTTPTDSVVSSTSYTVPSGKRLQGNASYNWDVRVSDGRGGVSVATNAPFSFGTGNRVPGSFSLLRVSNGSTVSSFPVGLSWETSVDLDGDAVSYQVYVGTSKSSLQSLGSWQSGTTRDLLSSELLGGTSFYWYVSARDNNGGITSSRDTFQFKIGSNRLPLAFTLLSPSDNEGNISLQRTLSWNESVDPDGDAVHYEVYLRTQGSLDYTRLFQSTKITQTESPSFRFKQGTSYEWKVVAEDAMGGRKESSVWDFTTTFPPTIPSGPPSPLGGQEGVVQPVTLSRPEAVDPDGDEINYDIYLWKRGASRKRIAEGLSTPSYTIPRYDLQGHTWYYWEVIAKDDKGGQSTYGKDSFLTANTFGERLVLLDPTNGSGSVDVSQSSVLFRWGQVIDRDGDAVSYQVYLGLDSRSLSALGSSQSDTFRNVQSSAIVGGRTFYWYVRSWDNYGGELLSDTFYFTIGGNRSPGLFTLDYPVSGMVNSYLDSSFHWSRSIDPDGDRVSYEVYWWEGGKSLPSDPIERTNDTTVRSLPKLQSNTLYRWKVVARDDGGSTREVGPQSFTTSSPPSRVSESGRSPSNGERDVSLPPRFAWEGSTDPDGDASNIEYDIYLGLSRGSLERIASSLSSPSYSLTGMKLLGHTWYYWQIVSRDEKGAEAYSQLDSFRTANRFPTSFSLLTPLDGSTSGIPAVFRWESLKDEDGDNIFYQFYIGTTRDNLVARGTSQLDTNFSLPELSGSSVFYWKVSAKDNYGGEIESSVWEFRLKDRKPTEFTLLYPSDRMTNVHLDSILYWSKSSDPDGGSVRYRVYIGIGGVPSSESYSSTSDTFQATVSPSLLADREYYWKVVAEDDGGATRGSSSFSFRTTQSPPSPNGGHRPSNGAVDVSIPTSLGWTGVDDPEGELVVYDVYFGSDRDNLALVSQGQRTASYLLPESELRGHTWYYWRVEALDPRGGKGVSTTDSFLTANRFPSSLSLLSPVDASTGNTVPLTLRWESLTDLDGDAVSYTLYLGTSIGGLSAKSVSQSGNSYILRDSDLEGSSTYYWRVEATDGYSSLSSSTNSFTLQNRPPGSFALVYPVEGQSNVRLDSVFRWYQSLDLDGEDVEYDLYYGVTDLPTQATERSLSDTTFRYQLLSGTTYRWQVLARDASTGRTFSTVWQFSTSRAPATPQNPRPSTGSLDVSIPLVVRVDETSDPDGDKVLYDLYFGTDKSSLPLVSSNSETPSYTPPASGLRGHTWYYWRVVAKDSKGASSSLLDSFRTANRFPTSVTLLSPDDNGLSSDPVELKWSSIDELDGDVVSYQVYFGTSLGGLSAKGSVQTDTTYRLTTADLDGSNEFYWRVEATDGEGGSAASVTRRFTLGNRPPGVFALRSPSDRASNVSLTYRIEWYRSIDPDRHDVRYDLYVGESLPGTASYSSLEDTFRVVKLESDKTYRWKVVADDNNSGTRESSEWSFSTTESPPSPDGGHRPSNGEVDVSIPTSLGWTGVDDPEGELVVYNVYFGSDRDNLALVSEGQTTTSYAIQESGLRGHTWYYWRVDALDPKGGKGESSLDSFRTANRFPGSFSLFSPANNSSDQTSPVTLRWESIEDADGDEISYRVFWGRSSAGLSEMALVVRDTFYRVPDDSLNHGSSYYWRVEASDGQGGQIVSVIYRFDMGNRSPNAFSLRWPTNGLENVSVRPVLSWDSSLDVDGDELVYDVYLGVDNVPSSASYRDLSDTFLTLGSSLSASSLYRWRVVAKDPHGGEKGSTTFWFETSGVPDRPISNKRPGSGQENISIPLSEVGVDKVSDPDGDKVLYDFYFGKKGSLQKVLTNVEEPVYVPPAESLTGHTWYYWRVVAKDGKGLESNSGLDSFRTANRFPTLLTLLRPADESLDLKEPIELVWEALDDLDGDKISYQLYYGSTEITLSKKGTQQSDTTYTLLSSDVSGSRYYWRVEGTDAYGGRVLSEVFSFTRPNLLPTAFSLVSPSDKDQSVSLQPEFSWTASSDGNNDELRYYITWWSSGNSRPTTPTDSVVSSTSYTVPSGKRLQGNASYNWDVRVSDGRGGVSVATNAPFSFGTGNRVPGSFSLLRVSNGSTVSSFPVGLSWETSVDLDGDAVSYQVYVGTSKSSLQSLGSWQSGTTRDLLSSELLGGTSFYWYVSARDNNGGITSSRDTFQFKIGSNRLPLAFTLLSPSDNEGNISLQRTLSWNESVDPDGDAVHYEVYLRTQGSLDYTRLFQSTKITQTESPSFRFKQGTSYEWKVVAEDAMGGRKESSVWDFTTTFPPTIPSGPPSPLGGQEGVVQPVTLSRPEAVDPDGDEINYDIYLWKRGASRKRIAEGLSTPSYTIPRYDLQGHTWYYWEVIAKDDKGGQSTYGKDSFLTANTFGERLVLLDPTNGSGSVDVSQSSVLFRWGQVIDRDGDAVSYQVYLGLDSRSLSALGSSQSDTFRNVQSSAIVGGRTFYWYVRSWDNYGGELLSDTFYFTIGGNRSPGLFTLDYPVSGMVNSYLDSSFHWSRSIDPDGDRVSYEVYWWEGGKSLPSDPIERTNDTTVRSLPKLQSNTLYRWKVVARDDGGSTREVGPQSFTTSSPPSRVSESGRSPSNGERDVSLPPRFAWEGSTDPDGDASNIEYDIYLGLSRGSLERIASSLSSPSYSLTGMKLLGHTWYYWQIVSRDEKGAEAYSQLDSFRTANRFPTSFSLLTPLDGSTSGIPAVFRWESLKDEDGDNIFYQFYIGTTRDNLVARGTSQLDTNFSLPELSGSSVFYWKVSAKDNYGGEIESSVWEFRLKDRKPTEFTLLYPSDRMTNVHLDSILYWSKSSDPDGGSVRYRVYIGIGGVPSSESYSSTSDTFQATVSPSLLADREYYWKVVAEDDGGATRGSSSFSFRTTQSPPSPNGGHRPSNGAVDVSIPTSLGWTGVDDPEGELVVYDVYFGSDRDNLALVSQGQRTASYVLPEGELRGHTWYYWRVEALDPRGGKGVSTTDSFLTANRFPSSLSLLSPVDASTGNTVPLTLSWESLTDLDGDAISYTLYLGTSIGGLSAKSVSQSGNSYILRDSDLEGSSTYYWRVEATDGYSSLSSSTNSFTLQNRPPGSFALVYPVEGQSNVRLDSVFRWNQSLDLDGDDVVYDLYYGVTDLPTQATERSLSDTTFRYQLLSGTTYRWQVLARDASTGRTFSTVWQFSTSRAPATPQNPRPSTGSLDVSIPLVVRVDETSDPDGDKVLYDLYFGTDKSSLPLVSSNSETPSYTPPASGLRGHTWYYWRVVAKDSKGASSSLLDSFRTANRFPTSVTLLSPDDNGLSSDPVELKWSSIDELDGDVVSYQVYFGTSLGGLSEKGSVQTDTTYRLTTADLDGSNEFYWRVEATDGEGGSAASVTRRFTLGNRPPGVFALRSPSDRASNVSLTCRFEWYRSIDPDRHDVRYDLYVGESLPGTASYSSLEDTFRVVKLESDKTYRWKVVADDNNSGTRESSEWSFSTTESPPSPDGGHRPSNGEVDVSIPTSLGWTGVDDPEGELVVYNVYFGSDRDNLALVSEGQTTTSYVLPESKLRGHTWYYWRVDALDPKGGKGESSLDSFRTANRFPGSFSLFSPANNSSDQTSPVTLRWESIEDADGDEISYRVFWGRSSAGLSEMALVVRDTFYRVPDDSLNHGSSYYWRVEASDGQGGQIVSVIYRFDMGNRSPNAFSLRWPTNGLENVSVRPVLSWDSSLDVDGDELFYDVYLGVDNVPSSASYSNLSDTFLTLGSSLSASSLYRWRVVARDPHGGEKSSTTFWFETSGVPDRPISNKRPGSGQENISIPLSEVGVDKVLDPDGDKVLYDFYFGKKGSLQKVLTNVEEPVYVPPAESLTGHTWYYWRVVAKDGKGLESNSGLDSFRTANRFPTLLTLLRPADGTTGMNIVDSVELKWRALKDPDGDSVFYQLFMGSTEAVLSEVGTEQSDTSIKVSINSLPGLLTYWSVRGTDRFGGLQLSEKFSFERINEEPTAFSLVSPSDGTIDVESRPTLSWGSSTDLDGQTVSYNVYWWESGQSEPTTPSKTGVTSTTYRLEAHLNPLTQYRWKVVATDGIAFVSSKETWGFTTADFIIDTRDDKSYRVVKIGNQKWLAENMNYTPPSGNRRCYENKEENCDRWGGLYDHETAKGVCPPGWALPSNKDWEELIDRVGDPSGTQLRSREGWSSGNYAGTDDYKFSALPGGTSGTLGRYYFGGYSTAFWASSDTIGSDSSYLWLMDNSTDSVSKLRAHNDQGRSVRCIQVRPTAFELLSPANGETNVTLSPTFRWSKSVDPNGGEIEYDLIVSGVSTVTTSDTDYQWGSKLSVDRTYQWTVRARDSNGVFREAGPFQFTTVPQITAPVELYPIKYEAGIQESVELRWSRSIDPAGNPVMYKVSWGLLGKDETEVTGLTDTTYTLTNLLQGDQYYVWKITAISSEGIEVPSTELFRGIFRTKDNFPTSISLYTPSDNTVGRTFGRIFSWEKVEDPDGPHNEVYYTMYMGDSLSNLQPVTIWDDPIEDTFLQLHHGTVESEFPNGSGTYYWAVKVGNVLEKIHTSSYDLWSDTFSFTPISLVAPVNNSSGVYKNPKLRWRRLNAGVSKVTKIYWWKDGEAVPTSPQATTSSSDTVFQIPDANSLDWNSTYHWKISINVDFGGAHYEEYRSETRAFTTAPQYIDPRDGKEYALVKIGGKTWMGKSIRYQPGGDTTTWCPGPSQSSNPDSYCEEYGRLYDWETAQSACPPGWHLPTDEEWAELADFILNEHGYKKPIPSTWDSVGWHLKSANGWEATSDLKNGNGIDDYGFTALPAGTRASGYIVNFNRVGHFWTATESASGTAYGRYINYEKYFLQRDNPLKEDGRQVRCLKDDP